MILCETCRQEMKCVKTGVQAVWGEGHCYSADRFHCPKCGATVLQTANSAHYKPNVRTELPPDQVVEMEAA